MSDKILWRLVKQVYESENNGELVEEAIVEIERLRARVEVLERDASRYQWLKNRKWMSLQTSYMKWIRKDSTSFIASHDLAADGTQYAPYETLDETIDAAMKEAKP